MCGPGDAALTTRYSRNSFAVNAVKPVNTNQLVGAQSTGHQGGAHGSPQIVYYRFGY